MHARAHARMHARMHERMHACTCVRTHPRKRTRANAPARTHPRERTRANESTHAPPTHTPPYRYSMGLCQQAVTPRSAGDNSWSMAIEINTGTAGPVSPRF